MERRDLVISIAPAVEPVSLDELKAQSRVDGSADDATLTIYGKAARGAAEIYQNRQLITATWIYTLESFPLGEFSLPRPPLQSITSIQYVDSAGATQTWASANYQVDTKSEPGRVKPVTTASYPNTQSDTYNAVTVTYVAGYGDSASDVPDTTRDAIMMWAAQLHEFREPIISGESIAEIPDYIKSMLNATKVPRVYS